MRTDLACSCNANLKAICAEIKFPLPPPPPINLPWFRFSSFSLDSRVIRAADDRRKRHLYARRLNVPALVDQLASQFTDDLRGNSVCMQSMAVYLQVAGCNKKRGVVNSWKDFEDFCCLFRFHHVFCYWRSTGRRSNDEAQLLMANIGSWAHARSAAESISRPAYKLIRVIIALVAVDSGITNIEYGQFPSCFHPINSR